MCGIIGVANEIPGAQRAWLGAGRDAMRHRGPDDFGEWWSADGRVGLGHRRLSIVDLSAAGHQPMEDVTGKLRIVFNGEIYNFRELREELSALGHAFRSSSDTEVLLNAYRQWNTECLPRLVGMFAFALYDAERQRLFLARDRAGEKPLFYRIDRGRLAFASELKGLMADPSFERRVNPTALDCYLCSGFVPGDISMMAGVRKLPAAHAMAFDLEEREPRVWRYWSIPDPAPRERCSPELEEEQLLAELEALLEQSIRAQLVADVPVGVLLSGGVDSSLITAIAARVAPKVRTFTIRFPGQGKFDETHHARLIARDFATDHTELVAEEGSIDVLPALIAQFDEPMADASMIPTFLVSRLVRRHCTVALGGEGGDELFGGYVHYNRWVRMEQLLRRVPRPLRALAAFGAMQLPLGLPGRKWLVECGADWERQLPLVSPTRFLPAERRALVRRAGFRGGEAEALYQERAPTTGDLLRRLTQADFESYLPEDILVKVDRASMLSSLEMRAPMLDHRIVELAFARTPTRLKAGAKTRKLLLKTLTQRLLPPEFDRERKQGFIVPLDNWMRSPLWQDRVRELLVEGTEGFFEPRFVSRLLAYQRRGLANGHRLFALLVLEMWRKQYGVAI